VSLTDKQQDLLVEAIYGNCDENKVKDIATLFEQSHPLEVTGLYLNDVPDDILENILEATGESMLPRASIAFNFLMGNGETSKGYKEPSDEDDEEYSGEKTSDDEICEDESYVDEFGEGYPILNLLLYRTVCKRWHHVIDRHLSRVFAEQKYQFMRSFVVYKLFTHWALAENNFSNFRLIDVRFYVGDGMYLLSENHDDGIEYGQKTECYIQHMNMDITHVTHLSLGPRPPFGELLEEKWFNTLGYPCVAVKEIRTTGYSAKTRPKISTQDTRNFIYSYLFWHLDLDRIVLQTEGDCFSFKESQLCEEGGFDKFRQKLHNWDATLQIIRAAIQEELGITEIGNNERRYTIIDTTEENKENINLIDSILKEIIRRL
jgi:hypothetical protein